MSIDNISNLSSTAVVKYTGKEVLDALKAEGMSLPPGTTIIETQEYTEAEITAMLTYNSNTRDYIANMAQNFNKFAKETTIDNKVYYTDFQYIDKGNSADEFLTNIMNFANDYISRYGNNDGNLDLSEFISFNSDIMEAADATKVFNSIDLDKKNGITAYEFASYIMALDAFDSTDEVADGKINLGTYLYYSESVHYIGDTAGIKKLTNKAEYFYNNYLKDIEKGDSAYSKLSTSQQKLYDSFSPTQKAELGQFVTATNNGKPSQAELDSQVNTITKNYIKSISPSTASDAIIEQSKAKLGEILDTLAGDNGLSSTILSQLMYDLLDALPDKSSKIEDIDAWAETFCSTRKITNEADKAAVKKALAALADTEGTNNKELTYSDISHMTLAHALLDETKLSADNLKTLASVINNNSDIKNDTGYYVIAAKANEINGFDASASLEANIKIIKSADKIDNNGYSTEWTKNERNKAGLKILTNSASIAKANSVSRSLSNEQKKLYATFNSTQKALLGKFALETNNGNPSQTELDTKVNEIATKVVSSIKPDDASNLIIENAKTQLGPILSILANNNGLSENMQYQLLTELLKSLPNQSSKIDNIDTWVDTFCTQKGITDETTITQVRNAVSALADTEGTGNKELTYTDISHMVLAYALIDETKMSPENLLTLAVVINKNSAIEESDIQKYHGYAVIAAKANEINGLDESASLETNIKIIKSADKIDNNGYSTEWTLNERNKAGLKIIKASKTAASTAATATTATGTTVTGTTVRGTTATGSTAAGTTVRGTTTTGSTAAGTTVRGTTATGSTAAGTTVRGTTTTGSTAAGTTVRGTIATGSTAAGTTVRGTTTTGSTKSTGTTNITGTGDSQYAYFDEREWKMSYDRLCWSRNKESRDTLRNSFIRAIKSGNYSPEDKLKLFKMLRSGTYQSLHNEQIDHGLGNLITQWDDYEKTNEEDLSKEAGITNYNKITVEDFYGWMSYT